MLISFLVFFNYPITVINVMHKKIKNTGSTRSIDNNKKPYNLNVIGIRVMGL